MSTKWQRVSIDLPDSYTLDEIKAIGMDLIDYIVKRAKDGKGKGGKDFKPYSEAYAKSLDFKIAGKSKNDVNLTLSGDMLGAIDILSASKGKLIIGFENGSQENAKADGNIRGTYGHSKSVGPKRDFLGLTNDEIQKIRENYPLRDREKSLDRADEKLSAKDAADYLAPSLQTEEDEG